MKYKIGESVLLLDTEFKPACSAVVRNSNSGSHTYEVEYQHRGSSKTEKLWSSVSKQISYMKAIYLSNR